MSTEKIVSEFEYLNMRGFESDRAICQGINSLQMFIVFLNIGMLNLTHSNIFVPEVFLTNNYNYFFQ